MKFNKFLKFLIIIIIIPVMLIGVVSTPGWINYMNLRFMKLETQYLYLIIGVLCSIKLVVIIIMSYIMMTEL